MKCLFSYLSGRVCSTFKKTTGGMICEIKNGDFCRLLITFANSLDTENMSVLIWIQTVCKSDCAPEIFIFNFFFFFFGGGGGVKHFVCPDHEPKFLQITSADEIVATR